MKKSNEKSRSIFELAFVFIASFVVYALTMTNNYSQAPDGIYYINNIDEKGEIFHPHHLLYTPLAIEVVKIFRLFGFTGDSIIPVSLMSSFFGSLTLCVFYCIMRKRLNLGIPASLIATALPAFSFGFWYYSVAIEVYMVPLLSLMLSIYFLTEDNPGCKNFALAGLAHGTAVLFHQVHVLFFPVVIVAALININRKSGRGGFWGNVLSYAATVIPVVAIPYLLVMIVGLHHHSIDESYQWLTWYTQKFDYWSKPGLHSLIGSLRGFGRSLVGLHYLFAIEKTRSLIDSGTGPTWRTDQLFLVRNISPGAVYTLLSLTVIFIVTIIVTPLYRLRFFRSIDHTRRTLIILSVVWFLCYALFFFFWVPTNVEFWIPQSLCWWLAFIALLMPGQGIETKSAIRPTILLAFLAVLIFLINFSGSIGPLHNRNNDYYYTKISPFIGVVEKNDLIITGHYWIMGAYIRRYIGSGHVSLDSIWIDADNKDDFIPEAEKIISDRLSAGGRVYISGEAVNLEKDNREILSDRGVESIKKLWGEYSPVWEKNENPRNDYYVLK